MPLEMVKIWGGGVSTTITVSPSPPPSEFCNDEDNSVNRSVMDALRNSKKITLLTVSVLFLFAFFNLILDTSRTSVVWYEYI